MRALAGILSLCCAMAGASLVSLAFPAAVSGPGAAAVAFAAEQEAAGSTFTTADKVEYRVLTRNDAQQGNTCELYRVPAGLVGLETLQIPEEVTSPETGTTYKVTSIWASAFGIYTNKVYNTTIQKLVIPKTIRSISPENPGITVAPMLNGLRFLQALEFIEVDSDNPLFASIDGVLYTKDRETLVACPTSKHIEGLYEVPDTVKTIYQYAFYHNTSLARVKLPAGLVGDTESGSDTAYTRGGIGAHAFDGCTALESVEFAEGAVLGNTVGSAAIGDGAFAGCTSLKHIDIPAIATAERKGSYHSSYGTIAYEQAYQKVLECRRTYADLVASGASSSALQAASDALSVAHLDADTAFLSGYMGYWHETRGPVLHAGLGAGVFAGCTSLESVVFQTGNQHGAFAYFESGTAVFYGCSALKTVVCMAEQPYWINPDMAMMNRTGPTNYWVYDGTTTNDSSCGLDVEPDLYYAVDYYVSEDAGLSDDADASSRIARVEFKRGTSTASIAANDTSALDGATPSSTLYAQSPRDGDLGALDPNAVAAANGLDTTVEWCWRLSSGQNGREGLGESCIAYLAPVSDISNGRVTSAEVEMMRTLAYRHLDTDGQFDSTRYFGDPKSEYAASFWFAAQSGYLGTGTDLCYNYDSEGLHFDDIELYDATGSAVSSYTVSFQACTRKADGSVSYGSDEDTVSAAGLYRATFTPTDGIHTGSIQQFVLVRDHASTTSVSACLGGDTASYTAYEAAIPFGEGASRISFSAPYEVNVVDGDLPSAIVASGIAGLAQARINVVSASTSAPDGFQLRAGGKTESYTRSYNGVLDSPADMAAWVYGEFKAGYASTSTTYSWGDTAILCSPSAVFDTAAIAAYAYENSCPVFFVDDDGSLGQETASCLKDFAHVLIAADTTSISAKVVTALGKAGFSSEDIERVAYDEGDACGFSIAVSELLTQDSGFAGRSVSISSGRDPLDCIAALNFTGHEDGLTLVSSSVADSKRLVRFLHGRCDRIDTVRIYGRDARAISPDAFDLASSIEDIVWDYTADPNMDAALTIGDTLVLHGVQFTLGANNTLAMTGMFFDGEKSIAKGDTFSYDQASYRVSAVSVDKTALLDAIAAGTSGLAAADYTSASWTALTKALSAGQTVASKASATKAQVAAAYSAIESARSSLVRKADVKSIAKAKLALSKTSFAYNGKAKRPSAKVTLGGTTLKAGTDFTVSYSNNKLVGTAKAKVKGCGKYTGTLTRSFTIKPAKVAGLNASVKKGRTVVIAWKNATGKKGGVSGYEVQVRLGKKNIATKRVSGKAKSKARVALGAAYRGKKLSVRVRAFKTTGGKKLYGAYSAAKSVTLK